MAVKFQILSLVVMFFISLLPFCYSQGSPEVFYPIETPSPASFDETISTKLSSSLQSPGRPPVSQPPPPQSPSSSLNDTNTSTIAKAVAATAACIIVIAGIYFFFVIRYALARPKRERVGDSFQGGQPGVPPDEFARINGNIKGLIVEENGLDVLYWRQLQEGANKDGFLKEILCSPKVEGGGGMVPKERRSRKVEPVQLIPLPRGKSSTSHGHVLVPPFKDDDSGGHIGHLSSPPSQGIVLKAVKEKEATVQLKVLPSTSIPPPQLPITPPPLPVQNNGSSVTPKDPHPLNRNPATPPPPVPTISPAHHLHLLINRVVQQQPEIKSSSGERGESSGNGATDGNNQGKLKPLQWDKVTKNIDLSMVGDKVNGGFAKSDDDLMEALFGFVATNRKSPK